MKNQFSKCPTKYHEVTKWLVVFRRFNAKLQYPQCISNGDTAVLHRFDISRFYDTKIIHPHHSFYFVVIHLDVNDNTDYLD